ncbi:heptaprenyl diphosphate synthase component 1 [Lentibacillus sp. Marseille-P4043]|uniref:heptaprenyl diphosphate synthase component 1 n=1 Tax=Lentibacillus sp. Marseille-P4043 TaxID=2040293 RepID=UPI000D0B5AD6|nr:heptaprenyl diphosphate synthase component 1 [Lentibacillus sp. Marseille-P4043]
MSTSGMELENIKTLIETKIQHTYLEKYIKKPVLDDEKLMILISIIDNTTLSDAKKKQYIITTMLVQIALDTHDQVIKVTQPDEEKQQKQQKQLTVLAGDYYSGLYYSLLAEAGDYDMIHVLASAIKEINEYKMKLYYLEANSFLSFIKLTQKIESLLFVHVAEHVKEFAVKNVIEEWLLASKLLQEREHVTKEGYSPLLDLWFSQSRADAYSTMVKTVETITNRTLQHIEQILPQLPGYHTSLKNHIFNQIKRNLNKQTTKAEEG